LLVNATDVLQSFSPASPVSLIAATSGPVYTPPSQVDPGQAGGAAIPPGDETNGLMISADSANTAVVYLLLGNGTASATNWHIALPAGTAWDGTISGCLWRGPVQGFSSAAAKLGVSVV
jgi:hypothetical protein